MKWGLKGEFLFDADSEPLRYLLWCGGRTQEEFTFIQIGSGHTVSPPKNFHIRLKNLFVAKIWIIEVKMVVKSF